MSLDLFPNISLSARMFFYTSNEQLSTRESSYFKMNLNNFIDSWKAHGNKLDASSMLIANRVLLIVVDQKDQTATGCSIDSMNRHLQNSGHDWFARNWVLYNTGNGSLDGIWEVKDLHDFHSSLNRGSLTMDTFIINPTVLSLGEAREKLVQKVSESWHMKML
tara:strand:+ start:29 stop:517 length:489 start_codon:yes stop_codon:yes gene_type:complete